MLSHVQQQYRHFTVDEYQDISPLQQALLETWLGDRQDLCVVGDPRQTIYSFAGADPSYLTGFSDRFPQAEVVELTKNYRSSVEIVALANRVSMHGELQPVRSLSKQPIVIEPSSASAEAKQVCERIANELEKGISPDEIAVLTRINSQLELIEKELNNRGIVTQVRGAGRFYRKPEVLKALTAIRALQLGAITEPLFAALSNILSQLGWVSRGGQGELWANLNWFMEIFDELGDPSLDDYLRELQERERSGDEPVRQAVTLATVHGTKGLEWSVVFVCGLSEGLFPISYAKKDAALAEERRLFYVAVTRAKDALVLSSPSDKPSSQFLRLATFGNRS
jgi:DNA helicase-2/ATP-dependent DNA helicase PcrA